jgi:hypothetical protein
VEEFEAEDIAKNGLCVVHRGRRIRMWKAESDELPAPGSSSVKKGFLNQQLGWNLNDGNPSEITLNIVVLWNVNASRRLEKLHLVMPGSAESKWATAKKRWSCEIPDPFLSGSAAPRPPILPVGGPKDLPISLPDSGAQEAEGQR